MHRGRRAGRGREGAGLRTRVASATDSLAAGAWAIGLAALFGCGVQVATKADVREGATDVPGEDEGKPEAVATSAVPGDDAKPGNGRVAAAPGSAAVKAARAFAAECASLAGRDTDQMTVVGVDGWLFLRNELRHVGAGKFWGEEAAKVSRASRPEWADPVPAILDFKSQLDALGIELVIVPVPPKAVIFPDKVSEKTAQLFRGAPDVGEGGAPPRLDPHHQAFYKLLREKGVGVIDLVPEFMDRRLGEDGAMYCRQDTHWSGLACVRVAKLLARHIRKKPWYAGAAGSAFEHEDRTVTITGDLWRSLADASGGSVPGMPRESLKLRFVRRAPTTREGGMLVPVEPDRESPVLLLADSHGLVFHAGGDMHAAGAGLADQLALELGFAVDVLGVRGSAASGSRSNLFRFRTSQDPDYIRRKKLVIWCFAAREFTEGSGWRKVPVVRRK